MILLQLYSAQNDVDEAIGILDHDVSNAYHWFNANKLNGYVRMNILFCLLSIGFAGRFLAKETIKG